MSSILKNTNRVGNFTSSNISKLCTSGKGLNGFGAPAITYIEEVNLERKLNRSIRTDTYSKDMAWGNFLETRVHELLEFGYDLVSNETVTHKQIPFWAGSTDLIMAGKKIGEIKCYQPKNFAKYADVLMKKDVAILKLECAEEYWQLVSNAVVNNVKIAEAIAYMPYESELSIIAEMAEDYDGKDQWKYRFISESEKSALAYLPDDGFYKNLTRFEFEVPKEDIEFLSEKVKLAGTMLVSVERKLEIV